MDPFLKLLGNTLWVKCNHVNLIFISNMLCKFQLLKSASVFDVLRHCYRIYSNYCYYYYYIIIIIIIIIIIVVLLLLLNTLVFDDGFFLF